MADVGLPGSNQISLATQTVSALAKFNSNNQNTDKTKHTTGVMKFHTTHNYLYKCPAANSGIKNTQVIWY